MVLKSSRAALADFLTLPSLSVMLSVTPEIILVIPVPAEEIVNAANNYDLVVMGTRGFGSMDDDTQGSVAEFVQKNSPKPVIFAKGMPSDWDDQNNFVGGENIWKDN